ncbi:glycosyl transferase family 9 [Flexistipes sinusarabici DSM 4947]|uniref:Glycosyl transferase family 9 n=1 Tax=Flexistipes sinusarabici (strain ATCC 49648 / DSM 4947 / MAS 10) TaxID=717231 RepID=F8E5Z1_FLESM|nr:glycosyltransferase family 9 protein [Flexistipes sinusarabici]AEI15832.1 glycosyl transferase family 9 [Flexistipes sinusarabici DSM 4947]
MKILVVRFSSLGDVILTTGVIKYLKTAYPDLTVDVLTYTHFSGVFFKNPYINKVLQIDKKSGFRKYLNFIQKNINDYDHIFDLHSKLSSIILKFFTSAGYHKYKKDSLKRRLFVKYGKFGGSLQEHVIQRYFKSFQKVFDMDTPSDEDLRPVIYPNNLYENLSGTVTVHPFASKKTKEWPFFTELIDELVKRGEKVNIIGDNFFEYNHANVNNFSGKTDLQEMFDIIKQSRSLITTDSGPMHVGIAGETPVVAIFGPTTKEFGFYPVFSNCSVLEIDGLYCRPCHVHGSDRCPEKHFRCMKEISVGMVLEKFDLYKG